MPTLLVPHVWQQHWTVKCVPVAVRAVYTWVSGMVQAEGPRKPVACLSSVNHQVCACHGMVYLTWWLLISPIFSPLPSPAKSSELEYLISTLLILTHFQLSILIKYPSFSLRYEFSLTFVIYLTHMCKVLACKYNLTR